MKKIIIISLIIIMIFCLLPFLFGKSNKTIIIETLDNNNYLLDNDIYRKIVTNNTQEEFYSKIKRNLASEYIEYQYNINNNELKSTSLKYNKINYYLCDITLNFKNSNNNYTCETTYKNRQLYLKGSINYTSNILSCDSNNDNISKEIINKYCNNIKDQIDIFIKESNKLRSNKKFIKAVRGE